MSYQHGAGAEIGNDKVKSAVQVDTVVAYIGTAPINLVLGYKEKGLINTPIKLENMPKRRQQSATRATGTSSHYASRSTAILRTQSETLGRSISSTY